MKVGSGLLKQLERCGLSAKLADEHVEAGEDKHGFRNVKTEIARAWASQTMATLPESHAALAWLTSLRGSIEHVGEPLDLVDHDTGEVLVSGRPGAVVTSAHPDVEVLVVTWQHADQFDAPEPEDDLGLLAMGLAASGGLPFRVATVALRGDEAFPRRSQVFPPAEHQALLARIRAAVSRPRIACPGDWCGSCRQSVYCPAWLARAKVALTVFAAEMQPGDAGADTLEITNENAGALAVRLKMVKAAHDLASEQLKHFVRHGGRCVVDGKEYYLGQRDGRETANVAALKADGLGEKYVKKGEPYEMPGWRKVRP
jgi:hypothetical protein